MVSKTVLVTGIGGNVGQGIVRNIKDLNHSIKIIGCDIESFTPGNHLCDVTCKVPYSYEESYINSIVEIVTNQKVDLIIPSTDYEVYYLSLNHKKISTKLLSCDNNIAKYFLDKFLTYQLFKEKKIPFAKSWLPSKYDFSEKEIIAKPRKGRGSRGILINPSDLSQLDDDYMIQKLHKGIEITTSVYVTKEKVIHGIFSMERKLSHGTTSQIIINDKYDVKLIEIAEKIAALKGVKGSFNIQSIVDDSGEVYPFEINGRISGTNSIRHNLGFQDVKYGIQEYLFNEKPDPVEIKNKNAVAVRILMDVIYPEANGFKGLNNKSAKHFIY